MTLFHYRKKDEKGDNAQNKPKHKNLVGVDEEIVFSCQNPALVMEVNGHMFIQVAS